MRALAITLIIACATATAACSAEDDARRGEDEGVQVVAGFYPLAELASQIGGDAVQVVNLTPAGAEAHDLELSPSQVDDVLDADLVLLVGGGFQPALEEATRQRDDRGIVDLAAGSEADPHFWLSPVLFSKAASEVRDALASARPNLASQFRAAATEYAEKLGDLDEEFSTGLADCDRRTFVTTHAAFGQLATVYGLKQESISGLSPESEPDPGRLAELSDRIDELGVTTVFVEPLAPRAAAETLAREAGVTIAELDPLESLRRDAVGDYFSVMRANLAALRTGLGCR